MSKVKVGIVGVGNCAAALVQGRYLYEKADENEPVAGLPHPTYCGFHVSDIEFTAAFDVDVSKVGLDLWEAIHVAPNCHPDYGVAPPGGMVGITVAAGPRLDGVGVMLSDRVQTIDGYADVVNHLADGGTNVVVNYLPVGSTAATEFYAQAAIDAGASFVNAIPVPLARIEAWRNRFEAAGLALVGDDIKSQVGATILHRRLVELLRDRGVLLDRTYQLNVGGNMDFFNMLERGRLADKKISKTSAVTDVAPHLRPGDVHIGPSDYVPWLGDTKIAFIRLEASSFGGQPIDVEVRLSVQDSSNSAGVVIDAIRGAVAAAKLGEPAIIYEAAAWWMKAPPYGSPSDDVALGDAEVFERIIREDGPSRD